MANGRSTTARGYGAEHQAMRRLWEPKIATGRVNCARCGKPIGPGEQWDLGHSDDRSRWIGPEHSLCNRSAGGRNGAAVTNIKRSMTIRDW